MGFRKDVKEALGRLEYKLNTLNTKIESKSAEIMRLEEQNKRLFDRLMSIDWEKYINQNPDRWEDRSKTEVITSPLTDDNMAGEILSDEEIGK